MNNHRQRPLAVGNLRAFEAVARLLSFSEAAEELHLTQSAVSRQIKSLEEEIGATLFLRGTRHVDLTGDGLLLHRALVPALERLDAGVRQIRQARGRKVVSVTTFASFASLRMTPLRALLLSAALTAFSTAVFSYGLGLPFERIGPWLR